MGDKKRCLLIGLAILITVLLIGSKVYMDKQQEAKVRQEEMIEVVKSEEAKKVFEEGLKNLDSKALTSEGVIQNYKIDYESIEQNPMGGINGKIVVNKNDKLVVLFNLNKEDEKNFDRSVISGNSDELSQLLKGID
ncbi:DUF1310 family protein [Listeria welshimeri]|uniref:Uncharacterized protein n=1 Tax=Listeria welshimeri serovar 6b (strain ATCC 35897 / DSM 20650 / CCUG 15529 / CIP 8149 / NCTC 11857 / SLCC 5334 / V8) TaxID=386043 RepID=A0AL42_LISW6|nr:DUF1310 family protein [Listeria welshimeri]CAK21724.1 hypothetical protein lwe2306 [Listeria welshimeri serovar 6b str. SLCC5334]SNV28463.1 Protein of uncharacterised function (DUF1310) [Listeria welshimeri]